MPAPLSRSGPPAPPPDRELLGLAQTLGAVLAGVGNNFCFKLLAALPVSELVVLRAVAGVVLLSPLLVFENRRRPVLPSLSARMLVRALAEASATVTLILALSRLSVGTVTSVLMTIPLCVTAIGAFVFRERAGWLAWGAIAVGLAGVLVVVRPTLDGSAIGVAAALASALSFSVRDSLTRRMPASAGTVAMTVSANLAALAVGLLLALGQEWRPILAAEILLVLLAVVLYVASNLLIAAGIRHARLALSGALRYAAVPAAMALDYLVLGLVPQPTTLLGVLLIVASGLAVLAAARRGPIGPSLPGG